MIYDVAFRWTGRHQSVAGDLSLRLLLRAHTEELHVIHARAFETARCHESADGIRSLIGGVCGRCSISLATVREDEVYPNLVMIQALLLREILPGLWSSARLFASPTVRDRGGSRSLSDCRRWAKTLIHEVACGRTTARATTIRTFASPDADIVPVLV